MRKFEGYVHILVIDDEPDIRYALMRVLENLGHQITEAIGAPDALVSLSGQPFDVVIVDLHLPDQATLTVIARARQIEPTVPIIVIAGDGLAGSARQITSARALNVNAILHKPFDAEDLIDHLPEATSRTRVSAATLG